MKGRVDGGVIIRMKSREGKIELLYVLQRTLEKMKQSDVVLREDVDGRGVKGVREWEWEWECD